MMSSASVGSALHGSWTVPVTSFRGLIGVVLYGILTSRLQPLVQEGPFHGAVNW